MSMVSVSRSAGPWQRGQRVRRKPSWYFRGDSPVGMKSTSSGSNTGRSSYGTGTVPHRSQYTMGMGVPQYRCRLMSQSRSR
ncbi:hypothetical protein HRbin31_00848 [bacterium HR31]|nr:hypothetical protein HRbin31_00848 [bacterium HR31]